MTTALTIPNPLPANLVVLSTEVLALRDALLMDAETLPITTVDEQRSADLVAKKIAALFKDIEQDRLGFGRQCKAVADAINAAAGEALLPLKLGWEDLTKRIRVFVEAENARRAEEARRIREEQERLQREEEARAAAERQRLQAIADAERARLQAEADAERARLQAEAEADAPPGELVPEIPAVEIAPIEVPVTAALPVRVLPPAPIPKPIASKAYSARREPELVIDDEHLVPFAVNGVRLWKQVDRTAIKTLLKAGIAVPGCQLVDSDQMAMRSR